MSERQADSDDKGDVGTLVADRLEMRFGGVRALDGASLSIRPGDAIGLLGPNGSGKTTMVNCLTGILRLQAGQVSLDGNDITRMSRRRRSNLGIVRTYQNLRLMAQLSVAENISVGLAGLPRRLSAAEWYERLNSAIATQGLEPFAHRALGEMPYGVMKRVKIARALVARPRILLLDEPAAGLGGNDWEDLANTLAAAQRTMGFGMLLIDHNVAFVRALTHRLVVLANGAVIAEGSPNVVLGDRKVAEVYLGSLTDA